MSFLFNNFDDMFKIYWRDTSYRSNNPGNQDRTLEDYTINSWGVILEPYWEFQ